MPIRQLSENRSDVIKPSEDKYELEQFDQDCIEAAARVWVEQGGTKGLFGCLDSLVYERIGELEKEEK